MRLLDEKAQVVSNDCVGPRLYILKVTAPAIAAGIFPGQFVHMKVPNFEDHILRRPFSVYAHDAHAGTFDILYQVVGCGTDKMTQLKPGDVLDTIGPIGQCWTPPKGVRKALLVGGGVGAAPLFMLAEKLTGAGVQTHVVLGASTSDALVCRARFESLACKSLQCATDDGSFGRKGFCTSLVEDALATANQEGEGDGEGEGECDGDGDAKSKSKGEPFDYLAVCGPEVLMKAVSSMAAEAKVACQVSMERRMACGIGACLSCVVETRSGKRRACVDGPIFDAWEIIW